MNKYSKLLWFLLGFGLFYFTRTTSFIPIAIALAPIFILRFLVSHKPLKGILLVILGFVLVLQFNFRPRIDFDDMLPGMFTLTRNLLLGLVLSLPYIATRLIKKQQKDFISTLIFPISAVTLYYLDSLYGPFKGVAIFYAYTQYGNLSLMQLLSIAGPWTLVFLLSWLSSIAFWLWEKDFNWSETRKGITVFLGVFIALLFYGGSRVSPFHDDYENKTVRIASAVLPPDKKTENLHFHKIMNERLFSSLTEVLEKIEVATRQAASTGAKIIAFQETSFIILDTEEEQAINELKRIAEENDIYVCIGYISMPELLPGKHEFSFGMMELSDEEEEGRNMAVLIDNSGKIVADYQKTNFVFTEDNWVLEGSGIIPVVETPYGRIGVAICKDMEFSNYMRQAGRKNADIVLAPSYEAYKSLSITYMQMLRSVENGFSFVRPCGNGLSIAVDYNGRILSSTNNFTATNTVMYADVPTKGVKTIYSVIGDLFAWLCILGMLIFIFMEIFKRKRSTAS